LRFGIHDSYTNLIVANLASVLTSQNRYDEAEPLAQQAAEGVNLLLGEDHPDALIHQNILAGILQKQEKYDQAEELYKKTYHIRDELLGSSHPRTLAAIRSVVRLLEKQGKHEEAEPLRPKVEEAIRKGYDDSN
jgi:tetratricopeptide (TPR) repeat protein